VIGEKTYGKGLVQYFFPLGDEGAGLKLTVSKYLTPSRWEVGCGGRLGRVGRVSCVGGGLFDAAHDCGSAFTRPKHSTQVPS